MQRTVMIVDDHDAFRDAARALLESEGFRVIGEASGGRDALARAEQLRPDVVLLDINLPDLNGFVVADQLAGAQWGPMIVLVSSREADSFGPRLHNAAARGFLSKRDLTGDALARLLA